ncbi:MAG: hypothetical protein E7370_01715 [Clostridiales bacterium]|nr:hypothetical protein [Clostridiales bacterium]
MKIFTKILTAILSATMLFSVAGFTACSNGELEAKIAELEAQITELQEQNQDLQADITEQQTQITTQQEQIEQQQEQIEALEQESEELNSKNADLQNRISSIEEQYNIAKYNAVILNDAQQYVKEDFLKENVTRGAILDDLDTSNESFPQEISYLIKNQEDFDKAFTQLPLNVNFDEEMLAVYIITDIYAGFDCDIKTIETYESELSIILLHDMAEPDISGAMPPSTSSPILRYFVVKLNCLDIENFKITMIYG